MRKTHTFVLEDTGQDFVEIDLYDNGVIKGYSIMFSDNRVSMIGIGTVDGKVYETLEDFQCTHLDSRENDLYMVSSPVLVPNKTREFAMLDRR